VINERKNVIHANERTEIREKKELSIKLPTETQCCK